MPKQERLSKIKELEKILKSKVICFTTSDRPSPVPQFISKDCTKILQQHIGMGKPFDTLSLFIVSHGGDMDVPWDVVNLARSRCKKFQIVIPYICHSAATMIAIGADEQIVGPRGQLSPTDPMLTVRSGTGPDAPTINFGVEDINAFVEFVEETLGKSFAGHGHEALGKLIDRVHPELLGSINRTYFRNKLLIQKLLKLSAKKHSQPVIKRIVEHLSVAYFAHGHTISRDEMVEDLRLPVVTAESMGCEELIWALYEDYAAEFESRHPLDLQSEYQKRGQNPMTIQWKGKFLESETRTDVYTQSAVFSGTGTPNFQFTVPQVQGVTPEVLQQIFNHFVAELQKQVQPLQVAKMTVTYGEWKTE